MDAGACPALPCPLSVRACRQGLLETYTFSRVLDHAATQAEAYRGMLYPLVEDFVNFRSRNNVLMAYGASGTGKTFTIQGTAAAPGRVPRALQKIFLVSAHVCVCGACPHPGR